MPRLHSTINRLCVTCCNPDLGILSEITPRLHSAINRLCATGGCDGDVALDSDWHGANCQPVSLDSNANVFNYHSSQCD